MYQHYQYKYVPGINKQMKNICIRALVRVLLCYGPLEIVSVIIIIIIIIQDLPIHNSQHHK